MLTGYKLAPMIFGTQNAGFRGGTENLPGIGASFTATTVAMTARTSKNQAVAKLKAMILEGLSAAIPIRSFVSYQSNPRRIHPIEIILFGSADGVINDRNPATHVASGDYLHNTILLSVIKKNPPEVCNTKIKLALEKKGIVISVGSACNTASPLASHVLYAMRADEYIRKGALRISLGDDNTVAEVKKFITEFLLVVKNLI
jgi:cysteine desulfurase